MNDDNAIIEVANLRKVYTRPRKVVAVDDISFSIFPNEVFALLGPNGSGKSTTLKMLLGLVTPDSGNIALLGHNIPKQKRQVLGSVGAILEGSRNLYWQRSVKENVIYFANLKGKKSRDVMDSMLYWAKELCMEEKLNVPVGKLSRGMQQKAALICCMSTQPQVLFLDEPLLGLDIMTQFEMEKIILRLKKSTSIILSSHDLRFIEKVSDRTAILKEGKIISLGKMQDMRPQLSLYSYKIVFSTSNNVDEYIPLFESLDGMIIDNFQNNFDSKFVIMEFTNRSEHLIFDVFNILKQLNATIQSIDTMHTSFEDLFLELVGGQKNEICIES